MFERRLVQLRTRVCEGRVMLQIYQEWGGICMYCIINHVEALDPSISFFLDL